MYLKSVFFGVQSCQLFLDFYIFAKILSCIFLCKSYQHVCNLPPACRGTTVVQMGDSALLWMVLFPTNMQVEGEETTIPVDARWFATACHNYNCVTL